MSEWRRIPGFSRYSASDDGRVRRDVRIYHSLPGPVNARENDRGYMTVNITDDSNRHRKACVHQLVLVAFCGPRPPSMLARHLDGNKLNNCALNLRYGTAQENSEDAKAHGTWAHGERAAAAKLTGAEVLEIVDLLRAGFAQMEIARWYGVTGRAVWQIASGEKWKHITQSLKLPPLPGKGGARSGGHIKLSDSDVAAILERRAHGETGAALAAAYGVSTSNISKILSGKSRCRVARNSA